MIYSIHPRNTFVRLTAMSAALIFLMLCLACNRTTNVKNIDTGIQFAFPDQMKAIALITTDSKEHYFEKVNLLDIQIQMQGEVTSENFLTDYKAFLKSDITAFTEKEKERLEKLFDEINADFNSIGIEVPIKEIQIVKTLGKCYGPQAFFTREKTIFIPSGQLDMSDRGLRSVILHEIYHIVSRYDSKIKSKAYELIGFAPLPFQVKNTLQESRQRNLLNPDGLDTSYGIRLQAKNKPSILAVPRIHSKHKTFKSEIPDYFDYINFDLFAVSKDDHNLQIDANLENNIADDYFNNFFEQISDNTQYIIHPDEIMADNFMLMVNAYAENKFDHFSESGKRIINKLHQVFRSEN